jgi:hypothetical protein
MARSKANTAHFGAILFLSKNFLKFFTTSRLDKLTMVFPTNNRIVVFFLEILQGEE